MPKQISTGYTYLAGKTKNCLNNKTIVLYKNKYEGNKKAHGVSTGLKIIYDIVQNLCAKRKLTWPIVPTFTQPS